ncbi:MAG: acyl carrier protein [Odoribacter sp.]|nr:acyl carrier protein [Odoribacter sp.]
MKLNEFTENVRLQFEDTDSSLIEANTEFKQLDEWSSLIVLSLIAMIDEEYNVSIKGEDINKANTVNDLFEIVKSKV